MTERAKKTLLVALTVILVLLVTAETVKNNNAYTWMLPQAFRAGPVFDIAAYGADPFGAVDASTAINNADNAAFAAGGNSRVYCTNGTFLIQAKVIIKTNADFSNCSFTVNVNAATVPWAIEVSTGNATNPTTILNSVVVHLPSITNVNKPGTGWASQGGAVRTVNLQHSHIFFTGNVFGFATGFAEMSYGGNGNVYNNIYGYFSNTNMIGLYQCPGDTSSWVNENKHFGGAFRINSIEGTGITGAYYVQDCKVGASGHSPNNHLFAGQTFEGDGPQYYVRTTGSFNRYLNDRWEGTTPIIYFEADSAPDGSDNIVDGGYGSQNIVFTYDAGYVAAGGTKRNNLLTTRLSNTTVGGLYGNQIRNTTSSGNPAFTFYEAGIDAWATPTNWSVQVGSQFLYGKRNADANPRIELDFVNGRTYYGNASVAPTCYLATFGTTGVGDICGFFPLTDATLPLGSASFRWSDGFFSGNLKSALQIATGGTAQTSGNITITGWGTGAAVSAVSGFAQRFRFTITAGTTPSANPTIASTLPTTFPAAPLCEARQTGGTGAFNWIASGTETTTATGTMTWQGTPANGSTYIVTTDCR